MLFSHVHWVKVSFLNPKLEKKNLALCWLPWRLMWQNFGWAIFLIFWNHLRQKFQAHLCQIPTFSISEHICMLIYAMNTFPFISILYLLFWKTQYQVDQQVQLHQASSQDSVAAVWKAASCQHCQWVTWNEDKNHLPLIGKVHRSCDRHRGADLYMILELHVQPKLQKLQPQCMQVEPQLGRRPFVGLRGLANRSRGWFFYAEGPFILWKGLALTWEAHCWPERTLCWL